MRNDAERERPEDTGTRNRRNVWTIATQPYKEAHFATFPEALVEPCILAGCPVGGLVLDPFAGSGTVLAVAENWQRRGLGCELNPDYMDIACRRIGEVAVQPRLDFETAPRPAAATLPMEED